MKRFYFIALTISALLTMFSCQKEEEEINLDITVENVCGHWIETQVFMNGQTFDVNGDVYDFNADGSFHCQGLESATDGTWSLRDKQLTLVEVDPTGRVTTVFNVDKLTNLTLVLTWEVNGEKYASTYKHK